ncbi:hypothetical protein [Salinibacterium sp. ZJ454]|uniref:hypothetical protein n=1 Tax=Salinibacterium sp. ZJ454 TaxID=2708339 RepID=UPI0014239B8B|nr:hypothetical protein [Salinibacterium sp. ZJ454]
MKAGQGGVELEAGISRCVTLLEEHLGITERRLLKSGPTHFAKARFDAIAFVARIYLAAESRPDHLPPLLVDRLAALRELLTSFVVTYPELDPVKFPRIARTRLRTEEIAEEIIRAAHLPRHRTLGRSDLYVGAHLIMPPDRSEEAPDGIIRLGGKFFATPIE